MHVLDVLEIVGAVTILLAFAAAQAGRLRQRTITYQLLNLLGSGVLATIAAIQLSWGFLLLEGSWAVISLIGLLTLKRRQETD
ncbi:CBU_0592 family membrane protein [Kribbella sp. CA-245084]|uniref:CBU_0592 family membrane protein n=1 Tax=Kribbella sp. CA-245084 TaxID=3239940 RepID=UPI003D8FE181